jgi:hypothetical protein
MTYPRVLVVALARVNAADSSANGLLLRSLLGEWPRENLGQIFSGGDNGDRGFFGCYHRIGEDDRWFGSTFFRLKAKALELDNESHGKEKSRVRSGLPSSIKHAVMQSGLYELVFYPRLSPAMREWVRDFHPDVIFAQGYSLGFTSLPLMLQKETGAPIAFMTSDDWAAYTYPAFPMRWILNRSANWLVRKASVRIAFGDKMRHVFEDRYGSEFVAAFHLDRKERFCRAQAPPGGPETVIAYVGGLWLNRYEAISDLLSAVRSITERGRQFRIHVYCPTIPIEMPADLRAAPEVRFFPLPSHDELPSVLAKSDILFLPESFSIAPGTIALSISSKCHLYMASRRPILAYGPSYSGTIDYATRDEWAVVITQRNVDQLAREILRLKNDAQYCARLVDQAEQVFDRNHDMREGQDRFRKLMVSAALRK